MQILNNGRTIFVGEDESFVFSKRHIPYSHFSHS